MDRGDLNARKADIDVGWALPGSLPDSGRLYAP
jgi:hypothetical protein